MKPGKLVPKFTSNAVDYTLTLASNVQEVKFGPLTSDSGASYVIKGIPGGEKTLHPEEGKTVSINFEVTAEDGKTTKTYTILVRRLSADDAVLSSLDVSVGKLNPKFSPLKTLYTCCVPNCVDSISVKAKPEDQSMSVTSSSGTPLAAFPLNPGETPVVIAVASPKGSTTVHYTVKVVRNPVAYSCDVSDHQMKLDFNCCICWGLVHRPVWIKGCNELYCKSCLMEATRTNKVNPLTGDTILQENWWEDCTDTENSLSKVKVSSSIPLGQKIEGTASEIGKLVRQSRLSRPKEEATFTCQQCSCKTPSTNKELHDKLICSAKHRQELPKYKIELQGWEKSMRKESGEENPDSLIKEAEQCEAKFLSAVSSSTLQDDSCIGHLDDAMSLVAAAIKLTPNYGQYHLKLGQLLEESMYVSDIYGVERSKTEDADLEAGEDLGSEDSKEDDFLAICQLHGVAPGAPVALQLKAVEAEYHSLKEAGQTHKAEQVQLLYAWKSKKTLQASQGSYATQSAGPLGRALQKYKDACQASPSSHPAHYHLGRLLLLMGDSSAAIPHLKMALATKPHHLQTRFCLGYAMGRESQSPSLAAILLTEGLSEYLHVRSDMLETQVSIKSPRTCLLAEDFWTTSNLLISKGFVVLAKLGGSNDLTKRVCLLYSSRVVWWFPYTHKGSTFRQLQWTWVDSRFMLQSLVSKQESLLLCKTLSSLLSYMNIDASPALNEVKLKTCQSLVQHEPWSSNALYLLGNAQLGTFETDETKLGLLKCAEKSYRASISCEGRPVEQEGVPDQVSSQDWWPADANKSGKGGPSKDSTKSSTSQPTGNGASKPAPGKAQPPISKPGPTKKQITPQKPVSKAAITKPAASTNTKFTGTKAQGVSKPVPKGSVKVAETKGKGVATLGELKSKTSAPTKTTSPPPQSQSTGPDSTSQSASTVSPSKSNDADMKKRTGALNKKTYHARLGLARVLLKQKDRDATSDEAVSLYKSVLTMAPDVHDAYIELGEFLAKKDPLGAVEVYSKFPFSDNPTFDDGYLYGEIARILMASEKYTDLWLEKSMIALGRILGIGALEKQFTVLETKFQTKLLKTITAGIHGKPVDDPSLQAFFKFKCWS